MTSAVPPTAIASPPEGSQLLEEGLEDSQRGLPVTIITGFLGSGKTTLLNHILSNQVGVKVAVLVNEFGEIGIDNELILTAEGDDSNMVELSNGCICCTINGEIEEAVYRLLERDEKVDYLVVETTGLADPLPVALTFLGTELRDLTRLDSIVTLVDAANYSLDLFNSEAAYNQILYADTLILNKTDLVDEATLAQLETKLREIKDGARILRTTQSQVPLPLILSVGLFESDRYFSSEAASSADAANYSEHEDHSHCDHDHGHCEHDDHDHGHEHHDHDHHDHDHHDHGHHAHGHHAHGHSSADHLAIDGFTSLSFESDRPFAIRKFQYFLDNQLADNIFRAKGILWFEESQKRHIFHLSGKRFSLDDSEWGDRPRSNRMVLIGQNMDTETIRAQLNACLTIASTSRAQGFATR